MVMIDQFQLFSIYEASIFLDLIAISLKSNGSNQ